MFNSDALSLSPARAASSDAHVSPLSAGGDTGAEVQRAALLALRTDGAAESGGGVSAVAHERGWRMNDRDSAYTDKLLGDALRLVTGGIDPDLASETCADALAALAKQAKALRGIDYQSEKTKSVECSCGARVDIPLPNCVELSKAMAQTAKMIDETARLAQFMGGKADSRPDLAGMPVDVLKALTDTQLAQVMGWVEANGRQAEPVPERGPAA